MAEERTNERQLRLVGERVPVGLSAAGMGDVEARLMARGHEAYRFAPDHRRAWVDGYRQAVMDAVAVMEGVALERQAATRWAGPELPVVAVAPVVVPPAPEVPVVALTWGERVMAAGLVGGPAA
jgi:hypothetical protein